MLKYTAAHHLGSTILTACYIDCNQTHVAPVSEVQNCTYCLLGAVGKSVKLIIYLINLAVFHVVDIDVVPRTTSCGKKILLNI